MTIAFIDANIFPHVWLTDVLLTMADFAIFEPVFSEKVLQEAHKALIDDLHRDEKYVSRYLNSIRFAKPYYLVADSQSLPAKIHIPDPDDEHVVASAYAASANVILTFNLKDFPNDELSRIGLAAQHPDEFLTQLACSRTSATLQAMHQLVQAKQHPPRTMSEELHHLAQTGLPHFATTIGLMLPAI